ncbi:MAG TPA: tetratricopeptide repeat protein, partial [Pyrinomonadaceae bacterium]|nr:tetratricopeptide repeat protein [Pyrinomonadaceae bacterium]
MKKWVVTASAVIALAALAATARRWLPPFLNFLGANSDVIQSLSDLVQLVLWGGVGALTIFSLWRHKKADALQPARAHALINAPAGGVGATAGGDVKENKFAAGGGVVSDRLDVGRDLIKDSTINIYEAPATLGAALHQLPSPPADFTGRAEELAELTSALERGGVQISGLRGMGGIGKTALALKLAERLKGRFPDAQFYLDLKGAHQSGQQPLSVADAMLHVIRAYDPTYKAPDTDAELTARYRTVLHDQRALLLLDNAADRAQVEPLLPPPTCAVIVTSRQSFHVPGLSFRDLDTLPPADAEQLLLTIAPRIGQHAARISELCGRLPLALRLAASALAERPDLTPENYLQRLADTKQRLKLLTGVQASLTLSYDLLTPDLQKLWRTLAVFPATFDAPAAAAVWQLDPDAAQDALGHLLKYSLLDWDKLASRYRLHDLARLLADNQLAEADCHAAQKLHAEHYLGVLRETNDFYLQGGEALMRGLALFDLEWANTQAGQAWAIANASEDSVATLLCSKYPTTGIDLLFMRQNPLELIGWLKSALTAARQLKARATEGTTLGNLGMVYTTLGETERAVRLCEQQLVIAREVGNRRSEGVALTTLGIAYRDLGEMHRAIEFIKQALIIDRELSNRWDEGNDLLTLGATYGKLGDTRRAIELFNQALIISRE